MKIFLSLVFLLTGIIGFSARAEAATHVLGAKKQALSPLNDTVSAGYYSSGTLANVDTDLAPGNIKSGVAIFGTSGTYIAGQGLPDTGQTVRYSSAPGDDSDYQPAAAQPDYTIQNPVGVSSVTVDNRTGLMWVTNPVDVGMTGTHSWEAAIAACEALTYATYSDWRLPNIKELASIVNYQNYNPAINTIYFPNTPNSTYWSSTTYVPNSPYAWYVMFDTGNVGNTIKTDPLNVRCVRAGP